MLECKNRLPQPGIEPRVSGFPDQRDNHYTTKASDLWLFYCRPDWVTAVEECLIFKFVKLCLLRVPSVESM